MELWLSVVDPRSGDGADVLADADPAERVGDLAGQIGALLGRPGHDGGPPDLYVGGVRVDPDLAISLSPIRDGAQLSLADPSGCPVPPAQGTVEVRVVGGPGAGGVHRLGPGTAVLGSGADAWIHVRDPDLPAAALEIDVEADGSCTVRPGYGALAAVEGEPVSGGAGWPPGQVLSVGRTLLELAVPDFPDAALKPSDAGNGLDYNRPPRLAPPAHPAQFRLPSRPKSGDARPLPWVMAVVPLVTAVALAMLLKNTAMLAFAVLSPLSLVANYWYDRKHGKKTFRRSLAEYEERKEAIEQDARAALAAEQAARRSGCPDPAAAGLIATGPRHRLWERRRARPRPPAAAGRHGNAAVRGER